MEIINESLKKKKINGFVSLKLKSYTLLFYGILIGVLYLSCRDSICQNDVCEESMYSGTIARWYNDKSAALSFRFDDGTLTQFTKAVPILRKYNLNGTFYITSNDNKPVGFWNLCIKAMDDGNEIGSHCIQHVDLTKIPLDSARIHITVSKVELERKIPGLICETFCYPFNYFNKTIEEEVSKYYIAACTGHYLNNSYKIDDYYALEAKGIHSGDSLPKINNNINEILAKNGWLIETIHGIDGYGYSPISSKLLEEHIRDVASNKDIWVSPVKNVVKYTKERDNAILTVIKRQKNSCMLTLEDGLVDSTYNVPLTLKIIIPSDWIKARVYNDSTPLENHIIRNGSCNVLIFNSLPNGAVISITE